jgi:hypothetical protein
MFHADAIGLGAVIERIEALAATGRADYWRVSPLLRELAGSGRNFAGFDATPETVGRNT